MLWNYSNWKKEKKLYILFFARFHQKFFLERSYQFTLPQIVVRNCLFLHMLSVIIIRFTHLITATFWLYIHVLSHFYFNTNCLFIYFSPYFYCSSSEFIRGGYVLWILIPFVLYVTNLFCYLKRFFSLYMTSVSYCLYF